VQGVGARVGLSILSVLDPSDLATAIATGDKASIGRANGVGPKLAARIAQELKDKAPKLAGLDPLVAKIGGAVAEKTAPKPVADAVSALVNLGYAQAQASAAIAAAVKALGEDAPTEKLIRQGLKELAR
jgi:holliday junction DNA helicase RuvA